MYKTINQFENQGWLALAGRHTKKLLSSKSNPRLRLQQCDSQMAFIQLKLILLKNLFKFSLKKRSIANAYFFHTGTSNLKDYSVEEMITHTREAVDKGLKIANHVIISIIIPRYDNPVLNVKAQKFNTQIFECYIKHEDVRVNDNCNLSLRPDQVEKFFNEEGAVHLNDHGTSVFAHNIKFSIANTLGVRIIRSKSQSSPNQSQYKKGKIRGHNKYRSSKNKPHFKHQDKGGG